VTFKLVYFNVTLDIMQQPSMLEHHTQTFYFLLISITNITCDDLMQLFYNHFSSNGSCKQSVYYAYA